MSERLTIILKEKDKITKTFLDYKAAELNINRTDLVVKALKIITAFDSEFIKKIEKITVNTNLTFAEIIKGFVTKRLAEIDAKSEVWGSGSVNLMELMRTDEGTPEQTKIYKWLKNYIKKEEERKKLEILLENEAKEIQLTDNQKEFLVRHKAGQVYYNSDQFKKDQEDKKIFNKLEKTKEKNF